MSTHYSVILYPCTLGVRSWFRRPAAFFGGGGWGKSEVIFLGSDVPLKIFRVRTFSLLPLKLRQRLHSLHSTQPVADPGFGKNGGPRSSAAGASIEAPRVGCEEVNPTSLEKGSGEGALPPPQKNFLTLDLKMSTSSAF